MTSQEHPKIVVGVVLYNDEGEIFLAKSYKWGENWIIPGGHLDWGESLVDCATREVKEETNFDVSNISYLGLQETIFPPQFHKKKHMIFMDYAAKVVGGEMKLNDELQEHIWINPMESLQLPLNPGTKTCIESFIAKNQK